LTSPSCAHSVFSSLWPSPANARRRRLTLEASRLKPLEMELAKHPARNRPAASPDDGPSSRVAPTTGPHLASSNDHRRVGAADGGGEAPTTPGSDRPSAGKKSRVCPDRDTEAWQRPLRGIPFLLGRGRGSRRGRLPRRFRRAEPGATPLFAPRACEDSAKLRCRPHLRRQAAGWSQRPSRPGPP